jgi:hypothetical protein
MKTIYLSKNWICIALLTICNSLFSQSFLKVLHTDSTKWDIAKHELYGTAMSNLYLSGRDSVSGLDSLWMNNFGNIYFAGKIREDTSNRKLFYITPELPTEYLIEDIQLSINDSFDFMGYNGYHLEPVDAVFFLNGRKHIKFNISTTWGDSIEFIEGVGPNISVIYQWPDGAGLYSVCTYELTQLQYSTTNPNFYNCQPNTQGVPDGRKTGNDIICYNDNENVYIRLKTSFPEGCKLTMYDINGKVLTDLSFTSRTFNLDISSLPDGFYILEIFNKNNSVPFKICKNN